MTKGVAVASSDPTPRPGARAVAIGRALGIALGMAFAAAVPAAAQGFNSPGVPNVGPPSEALLPDLAAWQDRLEEHGWLLRGQGTFILQGSTNFPSPYRGERSLSPVANARNTLSTDIVVGRRLWQGAEFILDASITRGFGLSNSSGVAAFPNNEAFRLGSSGPYLYTPRIFFRQTIGLSGDTAELDDYAMHFVEPVARERITITAGKFSVWDIFDDNRYAHDARTQFLNWALVGAGAFDFSADARGWTQGVALEWENGTWALRGGAFRVAREANGLFMDPAVTRAYQLLAEINRYWSLGGRPGAVRLLYGYSRARQSTWGELFANGFETFPINPLGYNAKQMVAMNWEQEITSDLGTFGRLSWNDGRTQNWMFTEMDRAVSAGLALTGTRWQRPADTVGLAFNVGWASAGRRAYLGAGGIGFITGDGRLNGGAEAIVETYYDMRVAAGVNVAGDAQLVVNPAYNRDRGPVGIFALRVRTAF